ncbi:MAG: thioredoxin family protein [Acidobacteriota bacterium]
MKEIKILGTGCAKCNKLQEITESSLKEMNIEYNLVKVTDLDDILSYGIMMTPGLVVDGEVKSSGKLPSAEDLKKMLS